MRYGSNDIPFNRQAPSKVERHPNMSAVSPVSKSYQDATNLMGASAYSRIREETPLSRAKYHKGYLSTNLLEFVKADPEVLIAVDSILVANVTDATANFSLQHVPRGASTGVEYSLFNELDVRKNTTIVISDAPIYLTQGDALYAQASIASSLVMSIFARRH
jgi:hypothetical protein